VCAMLPDAHAGSPTGPRGHRATARGPCLREGRRPRPGGARRARAGQGGARPLHRRVLRRRPPDRRHRRAPVPGGTALHHVLHPHARWPFHRCLAELTGRAQPAPPSDASRSRARSASTVRLETTSWRPLACWPPPRTTTEHHFVVADIAERLAPLCDVVAIPDAPRSSAWPPSHTWPPPSRGTLTTRPDGTTPDALALLAALHPTPAVGASPWHVRCRSSRSSRPHPGASGLTGGLDRRSLATAMGHRQFAGDIRGASATLHAGARHLCADRTPTPNSPRRRSSSPALEALSQGASSLLR